MRLPDVILPDLRDRRGLSATGELQRLKLVPDVIETEATDPADFEQVIDQVPAPGSELRPGDSVTVVVAVQPKPELVPSPGIDWDSVEYWDTEDRRGVCTNGSIAADGAIQQVVVSCDDPHDFQWLGSFRVEAPLVYDQQVVDDFMRDRCPGEFEAFVGVDEAQSSLDWTWIRPSKEYWVGGGRLGWCLILSPEFGERIVGSAEGSLW